MIKVAGVTYHYGVRPVLRGIDPHVQRGELVALMRPNGMGKSTLMGVIAEAISPRRGEVLIGGLVRRRTPEAEMEIRRRVFYLPADPWLPQGHSGREWLVAVGRLYDIRDKQIFDHVERLLALLPLFMKMDWWAQYSVPAALFVLLLAAMTLPPSRRRWQLTGEHRMIKTRRVNMPPETRAVL